MLVEAEAGTDGQHGKMSVCMDCMNVAVKQLKAGSFTLEELSK